VPFNSIVLVKQVPDTANVTADAMKDDGTVNRGALPAIFNPEDLYALEAALDVRDRFGGTVTCIAMGPPKAGEVLRDCLFLGADRVILLTDRRAAASDTLATSYILSQAVKTVGDYDFVFCGRQAIDGDTAQTGPQAAEKLGIPQVTYLEEMIDIQDKTARIRRNIGNGWEVVDVKLPTLVTVIELDELPRPLAARRIMKYKRARVPAEIEMAVRKEMADATDEERQAEVDRQVGALKAKGLLMEQWDLDDINADIERCGLSGSPTKVFRIQSIILKKDGHTRVEPTEEGVRGMIHELVQDRVLG